MRGVTMSAMKRPDTPGPRETPKDGKRRRRILILAIAPFCGVPGCVTDAQLLSDHSAAALQTAKKKPGSDLHCPRPTGTIQSKSITQGAPLGYLWTDDRVNVEGCGRHGVYGITCFDELLCSASEP